MWMLTRELESSVNNLMVASFWSKVDPGKELGTRVTHVTHKKMVKSESHRKSPKDCETSITTKVVASS